MHLMALSDFTLASGLLCLQLRGGMLCGMASGRKAILRPAIPISEYQVCRGGADDYDHGNHHLARATTRPADPGLVIRAALSALGLPDTDAPIIDKLAQASDTPILRVLADAALLDRDRRAHTRRSQGHRRRVFQRLLRRSRRVCGRRRHLRRAQPTPTPRPT